MDADKVRQKAETFASLHRVGDPVILFQLLGRRDREAGRAGVPSRGDKQRRGGDGPGIRGRRTDTARSGLVADSADRRRGGLSGLGRSGGGLLGRSLGGGGNGSKD